VRHLEELSPRTVLFDVEPLIAYWDTDRGSLEKGVAAMLRALSGFSGIGVVGFVTNSRRASSVETPRGDLDVFYVASAGKPFRARSYRDLPRPGAVVGDQVATDGVLAWRLGYSFLHYCPWFRIPLGPRLMRLAGLPLRPLLFRAGGSG